MADRTRSSRPRTLERLPGARQFITTLLGAVPAPPPALAQSSNPLKDGVAATAAAGNPAMKSIFLALHVIFPNELLPALDVLDRGLVVRLRTSRRSPSDVRPPLSLPGLLLVRSAQQQQRQRTSYHRNPAATAAADEHVAYYEVRLEAWSCSCPAFAFSAFPARSPAENAAGDDDDDDDDDDGHDGHDEGDADAAAVSQEDITSPGLDGVPAFRFGGCSRVAGGLPVCKHLLACVLAERCAAFAHLVDEREVTDGEMAGWAAGWGD